KLSMQQVLAPAIDYARNGFPVADELAYEFNDTKQQFANNQNFTSTYYFNGQPPQKGDIFKNPYLASTLNKIATGGRDAFYKGDIAKAIDAFMKKNGGYLSYKDMVDDSATWVDPVSTTYRGYRVWELPPNGQGIAVLQMLNILEGF